MTSSRQPGTVRSLLAFLGLTLALGATVVASWAAVGGTEVWNGPWHAFRTSGLIVYAVEVLLAAAVTFVFVHLVPRRPTPGRLLLPVGAAWIGELAVLLLIGPLLANELEGPYVATFMWIIGTGGPVQPIAAVIGGLVSLRLLRRRPERLAAAAR